MSEKKVTGVLKYNQEIRNEHLKRNNDKYFQYDGRLTPAIGDAINVTTRDLSVLNDSKPLYEYTHNNENPYSQAIRKKYFNLSPDMSLYEVLNPSQEQLNRWGGQYIDYLTYVSEVYGHEYSVMHFVNKLFSDVDISYSMGLTRPGIVRDLQVPLALAGVNVTNINNYSGTDTRLGRLTNQMFSRSLYRGAVFNTERNRGLVNEKEWEGYGYITPSLYKKYGNNMVTLGNLSDTLVPSSKTGRLVDALDEVGKIVHDYTTLLASENGGKVYLDDQIKKANQKFSIQRPYIVYTNHILYSGATTATTDDIVDGRYLLNSQSETSGPQPVYDGIKNNRQVVTTAKVYNKTIVSSPKEYFVYLESDNYEPNMGMEDFSARINTENNVWEVYNKEKDNLGTNNLLAKTNQMFKDQKITTMVGRFHIKSDDNYVIDTAINDKYGNSHGRNLLRKNPESNPTTNGFKNPYCRVWTYHHQYKFMDNLVRPFSDKNIGDLQKMNARYRSRFSKQSKLKDGGTYLADNTVLGESGRVNIAPSTHGGVDIKKCMFSIENLAWKDVAKETANISKEQIGPNGGRIMWFPPYDIDFNESVNVNWQSNTFIGRGEDVYTYTNTTRSGTLSFSLIIDHPSVMNSVTSLNDSDDIDADILRFFAGCNTLDPQENENARYEPNSKSSDPTLSGLDGPHVRIYCFFPNNYSGNGKAFTGTQTGFKYGDSYSYASVDKKSNQSLNESLWKDSKNSIGCSDDENGNEWWRYLYCGSNATAFSGGNGYEIKINKNKGITTDTATTENTICACNKGGANREDTKFCSILEPYQGTEKNKHIFRYRVDFDSRQPRVNIVNTGKNCKSIWTNFSDTYSLGLNHDPLIVYDKCSTAKNYKPNETLFSFEQLLYALGLIDKVNSDIQAGADVLKAILTSKEHVLDTIYATGAASSQDGRNATALATRRGHSLMYTTVNTLKALNVNIKVDENIKVPKIDSEVIPVSNPCDNNSDDVKAARHAFIDIYFDMPNVKNVPDSGIEYLDNGITAVTQNGTSIVEKRVKDGIIKARKGRQATDADYGEKKTDRIHSLGTKSSDTDNVSLAQKIDKTLRSGNVTYSTLDTSNLRYESEADYFYKIQREDPVIFKKLVEKFKYFDPAFHSMSPEGFNARLTFLQQCTRQGHTISATESNGLAATAGNLAFGRMPVCVLRLGDFLNTRIIIESLSINYNNGGMLWDLNPEGAGVQPMYAKVSMSIKILGGQSLEAPISRLQNAVSFNYYANAGVYDNRADRAHNTEDYETSYDYLYTVTNSTKSYTNNVYPSTDSDIYEGARTIEEENGDKISKDVSAEAPSGNAGTGTSDSMTEVSTEGGETTK